MPDPILSNGLNPQQKIALEYTDGPLLILAGAGSGKTKLVTHKYAYLYEKIACKNKTIFTATFTNKAANEMNEKLSFLLSGGINSPWIGTFHSHCNRILRKEICSIGLKNDFVIYDADDQAKLIRHILKDLHLYEALYKGIAAKINQFKASLLLPDNFFSSNNNFDFDEKLLKVYTRYQDEMKRSNSIDFSDLIIYTIKLFKSRPEILEMYQELFTYILVDDFQDTNYAQYNLIRLLSNSGKNICVVGDDDQSVYKFRGANIDNILLHFEKDFPMTKTITLEQNYRSTQNILGVSHGIISKVLLRRSKKMWTNNNSGEKVCYYWFASEIEEAKYVAKTIKDLYLKGICSYHDIAVFYRVNLQAKALEKALKNERVPYKIIGEIRFYHKKEIKDIISYMRLIINKDDNVSLRRIINIPQRGIGVTTLKKIENEAKKEGISLYVTIRRMCIEKSISPSLMEKLHNLLDLLDELSNSKVENVAEAIELIDELTNFTEVLDENSKKHLSDFISSNSDIPIKVFLDTLSLTNHQDEPISLDNVSLMTLHNAKGLEFPVVFITGLEDGLLPYFKAIENYNELDEERRLFYMGMTRAKENLFVTGAKERKLYSRYKEQEPSRFLKDIPRECCSWFEKKSLSSHSLTKKRINSSDNGATHYNTGCRVKHPKWGIGVIRDCYGEEDDIKVTINFPSIGIKKLALKFVNLERI